MNPPPTLPPIFRKHLKPFIAIFATYIVLYAPMVLAGRPQFDDMSRGTGGGLLWSLDGRPLADFLFAILNLGVPATSVYFLNQLVALIFLSLAGLSLVSLFEIRNPLIAALAALPLGGHPYFLENINYSFDAPLYSAGLLMATLAAVLIIRSEASVAIGISILLFLSSLLLYQPTCNVYFFICAFFITKRYIDNATNSSWFFLLLRSVTVPILGMLIYWIYYASILSRPYDPLFQRKFTFEGFSTVMTNFLVYWHLIWDDFGVSIITVSAFLLLIIGLILVFLDINCKRLKASFSRTMLGLLVLLGSFLFQFGIMLPLIDPVWAPRVFVAAGTFLALAAMQVGQAIENTNAGWFAVGIIALPIVVLDYSLLVIAHAAAAASRAQMSYESNLASRIIADIEQLPEQPHLTKLAVIGSAAPSPVVINSSRKFPIIRRIVTSCFDDNSLAGSMLLLYNGLSLDYVDNRPYRSLISEHRLQPSFLRRSYSIYVDETTVIIRFSGKG